jgi:hypothetical protein
MTDRVGSDGSEPVSVGKARVIRATAKALFVHIDDGDEEVWIPKSCIHDDSEVYAEDSEPGELVVVAWFARKEGWD